MANSSTISWAGFSKKIFQASSPFASGNLTTPLFVFSVRWWKMFSWRHVNWTWYGATFSSPFISTEMCSLMAPDTADLSVLFSKLYQTSISPDRVLTSIIVWPKKSSDSRVNFCLNLDFKSLSSSQTRTLIRSDELWHSKKNFSFQTGLRSWGMVRVLFLTLPTWTVTYGSDVPPLSLAVNPWAHMTVMAILADHLDVPSKTVWATAFMCPWWLLSSTPNTSRIISKISGFSTCLWFILSFMAFSIEFALSSAPCFDDFSAALCRQSAFNRSLHFSWHLTPHSVHLTPCRAIPHRRPSHS